MLNEAYLNEVIFYFTTFKTFYILNCRVVCVTTCQKYIAIMVIDVGTYTIAFYYNFCLPSRYFITIFKIASNGHSFEEMCRNPESQRSLARGDQPGSQQARYRLPFNHASADPPITGVWCSIKISERDGACFVSVTISHCLLLRVCRLNFLIYCLWIFYFGNPV